MPKTWTVSFLSCDKQGSMRYNKSFNHSVRSMKGRRQWWETHSFRLLCVTNYRTRACVSNTMPSHSHRAQKYNVVASALVSGFSSTAFIDRLRRACYTYISALATVTNERIFIFNNINFIGITCYRLALLIRTVWIHTASKPISTIPRDDATIQLYRLFSCIATVRSFALF